MYSDDPNKDFLEHDKRAEEWLNSRPVCSICGKHIQDDWAVYLDDWICQGCLDENTRFL